MLYDNLPLPLPWYPNVTLQDRFRQNVAMNAVITQLGPCDGLLPFQLRKPSNSALPVTWKIRCAARGILQDYLDGFEDPEVVDMSDFITDALEWMTLVDPVTSQPMDYFIFKNGKNSLDVISTTVPDGLTPGVYYMELDFGPGVHGFPETGGKWCSETFRVPVDLFSWNVPRDCNYPCFKWSNDSDIIPIHYDAGDDELFYNLLYLDTWITASEPEYEVEGANDGVNEFIPNFQKAVIKYRLSTIIPDYIKIALYLCLMHENKYIFTEKSLRQGDIKNMELSSSLSTDGALSVVEILFEQMSLMVKTGCVDDMVAPEPYEIEGGQALDTGYCEASGSVNVQITDDLPVEIYGELWGKVGAGPYVLVAPYISRDDLITGWTGTLDPNDNYGHFKVVFRTFTFVIGESAVSVPGVTC